MPDLIPVAGCLLFALLFAACIAAGWISEEVDRW